MWVHHLRAPVAANVRLVSTRANISVVFGLVALLTTALPATVIAALAQDLSVLILAPLAAAFAAAWSAVLSGRIEDTRRFGYLRGLAIAVLSFLCVGLGFSFTRPFPFTQAFIAFLVVGWGFLVFPGFVGAAVAVWLLRFTAHEPNSTVERDAPQAARPSQ